MEKKILRKQLVRKALYIYKREGIAWKAFGGYSFTYFTAIEWSPTSPAAQEEANVES